MGLGVTRTRARLADHDDFEQVLHCRPEIERERERDTETGTERSTDRREREKEHRSKSNKSEVAEVLNSQVSM